MYKLFLFVVTVGGFVLAGSVHETANFDENSSPLKYSFANDFSYEDDKLEAGRRRGKQNRGDRRRGGGGLR